MHNWFWMSFLCNGNNNEGGSWGVWSWRELQHPGGPGGLENRSSIWMPFFLGNGEFVASGTPVGVDTLTPFDNTWFFADTITITVDKTYSVPAMTSIDQTNAIAQLFFDYAGAQLLEIELTITNASVSDLTKVNAIYWTT